MITWAQVYLVTTLNKPEWAVYMTGTILVDTFIAVFCAAALVERRKK